MLAAFFTVYCEAQEMTIIWKVIFQCKRLPVFPK